MSVELGNGNIDIEDIEDIEDSTWQILVSLVARIGAQLISYIIMWGPPKNIKQLNPENSSTLSLHRYALAFGDGDSFASEILVKAQQLAVAQLKKGASEIHLELLVKL